MKPNVQDRPRVELESAVMAIARIQLLREELEQISHQRPIPRKTLSRS